jgi:phosphatidylinositol glycan class N
MYHCHQEYMNSIRIVDTIVRQTEVLFTEFYKDEETSFIFTADHGMSNIGNHGDGGKSRARRPLRSNHSQKTQIQIIPARPS